MSRFAKQVPVPLRLAYPAMSLVLLGGSRYQSALRWELIRIWGWMSGMTALCLGLALLFRALSCGRPHRRRPGTPSAPDET